MPVTTYKPTTPGRRKSSVDSFVDITKNKPEKSLVVGLSKKSGRNNTGRITVRHRGGGAKRLYRLVDFTRNNFDQVAEVKSIEYDPNRGARVALVEYKSGVKSYILAAAGLKPGEKLLSSNKPIEAKSGNRMPIEFIPVGLFVYNVELMPSKGGQLVRGAGTGAQLMGIEGKFAQLKMPSGEVRTVPKEAAASIGTLSNPDKRLVRLGKAGRRRHLGFRPTVKGKNMNPVDHAHGGGEGHSPIGQRRGPQTVYGKTAMGVRTRKKGKWSDSAIVRSRRKKRR
jgi:large subunit ribosomal protein L2